MRATSGTIEFESTEWGTSEISTVDLELLTEISGLSEYECLDRLQSYDPAEMAAEWHARDPRTPEEIRSFYSETDLYIWELLAWNGSRDYEPYIARLNLLAELCPPRDFPRSLDYGCGIGTAAVRLAEHGYRVTIADVPGTAVDFAKARLSRRKLPFEVLEIVNDVPTLPPDEWDVLVCFDVLEHLVQPDTVARALVRALRVGGGAAIVASFWVDERWPHHLESGHTRFGSYRWDCFLQSLGVARYGDLLYRRTALLPTALRRLRYAFWRRTGLYVQRLPR
jgi:SAM-dependent methyltransferase